jgi:2-octaprenyl-6-methoxyphenol hydroxylase
MGRMSETLDVTACIIGAGPVGATLAATLAEAGIRTAVIDRAPLPPMEMPEFDGRAYAIALTSRRLLEACGVWDRLPAEPCPIHRIHVADGRPGERPSALKLDFEAAEVGEEAFGWMVEARSLRVALNARLPHLPNLSVFAPARAEVARGADGAEVRVAGGPTIRARLVIGAEGRDSALRREAGIPVSRLDYGQVGMVGAFAHEWPHGGAALEMFLPNGPFAQLPLAGPAASAPPSCRTPRPIVWSERTALRRRFWRSTTRPSGGSWRGGSAGISGASGRSGGAGPTRFRRSGRSASPTPAWRWSAMRARHPPDRGQGLNLGFRDVAALAEAVIAAAGGEDPGGAAVLARYQRGRGRTLR